MLIEVEVEARENCDYSLTRVYTAAGARVPVRGVEAPGPRGDVAQFDVIGWSSDGPCQAYAVPVDDSGEGRALLIYGGDDGVRLRLTTSTAPWSIADAGQWGEPCLLLDKDAQYDIGDSR